MRHAPCGYSAAVASASWLTDAAYPLRVHPVFLRFPNLILEQNLSPPALADFIRAFLAVYNQFGYQEVLL